MGVRACSRHGCLYRLTGSLLSAPCRARSTAGKLSTINHQLPALCLYSLTTSICFSSYLTGKTIDLHVDPVMLFHCHQESALAAGSICFAVTSRHGAVAR